MDAPFPGTNRGQPSSESLVPGSATQLPAADDRGLTPARSTDVEPGRRGAQPPPPAAPRPALRRHHRGRLRAARHDGSRTRAGRSSAPTWGSSAGRSRSTSRASCLRALGWQKLFPAVEPPGSGPVPRRLRRRRRERRGAAVPARLPGQDRHAAPDARRQARARGDRALDHLARPRRRDRVPAALDLGDGDDLLELPHPAAARRPLRRRRVRPPRRRPTPRARAVHRPPRAPGEARRAGREPPARHHARGDRGVVLPARLLDVARAREHAAARRARRRLLAAARPRRPLPGGRRLADPDRLGRRDRQRQRNRRRPARARRAQGAGDQLRPRLRSPALRHRRVRRARRRRDLLRARPPPPSSSPPPRRRTRPAVRDNQAECSRGGLLWRSPPAR